MSLPSKVNSKPLNSVLKTSLVFFSNQSLLRLFSSRYDFASSKYCLYSSCCFFASSDIPTVLDSRGCLYVSFCSVKNFRALAISFFFDSLCFLINFSSSMSSSYEYSSIISFTSSRSIPSSVVR